MGSKGRIPPPFMRRPHPGPGIVNPDPYGPNIRPPPGVYSPLDMLPSPEVMEQKLDAQHIEMQKLARENQRLAATHGTLRQQLAAAQHEQQILRAQIEAVESEREQQMRNLTEKIAKMEAELKAFEPARVELQQARAEAHNLAVARQELMSRAQHLSQDLHRARADLQQIPALMSELEGLRQEYQHCRATYDYEKKLYNDHLESLQAMEKNYMTMAREVEKLRAQLTNAATGDTKTGGPYTGTPAKNDKEASGQPVGQNALEDSYSVPQGHAPVHGGSSSATAVPNAAAAAGTSPYAAAQSGTAPVRPGYDAQMGMGYGAHMQHGYDAQRGPVYDAQRGPFYDAHRGPGYDSLRGPGYDAQRAPVYDMQRGPAYDASRGSGYDPQSRGVGPQGQVASSTSMPYGSAMPAAPAGSGRDAPRVGNTVRK